MLARFRLKAGQHIASDPTVEQTLRPDGTPIKRPSKTYHAGDVVEDNYDLVAKFGANRFDLLSGKPLGATPLNAPPPPRGGRRPAAADTPLPTGQTVTLTLADGRTVTGTISAADSPSTPAANPFGGPAATTAPTTAPPRSHFEHMNKAELTAYAENNEIDLGSATAKGEMIDAIMAELAPDE
jgi:hypothetical protein